MSKEKQLCKICGKPAHCKWEKGDYYCKKHYMQMYHHGKILKRTIFDKNKYILYEDYAECVTYNKNSEIASKTKVDLNIINKIKDLKIYIRYNNYRKPYAMITLKSGRKCFLHRFILGLLSEYNINKTVDHINGDSLDNRLSNLRICPQKDNMKNIRKKGAVVGVYWLKTNKKWTARITSNYKSIHLGNYENYRDAVLARLKKEKEMCGEYGPNKDSYYLLNQSSSLKEDV